MTEPTLPIELLQQKAQQASQKAYAPYSNFPVGAALLMKNGEVVTGCNVENVSFGLSNCAERTAIFSALAQGFQPADFQQLVVFTPGDKAYAPCGACRQVIAEFFAATATVASTSERQLRQWTVAELLPDAFSFDSEKYRKES
ncbi:MULTISPECIES: cytidine deaminase [Pseudidiomarina]|jgi:cytidine deaminase|uniref:Cytidine deaminase n=1 Tax=Pseudidiomarina atlantica TaxID=1517416 RepID=A0A094IJL4_9GAMM|nr:cytidine deaminase [Pseudidiomarina atlantica]KFZ27885.1 cytidine deaminase [Pseudidiomarina atlantica]